MYTMYAAAIFVAFLSASVGMVGDGRFGATQVASVGGTGVCNGLDGFAMLAWEIAVRFATAAFAPILAAIVTYWYTATTKSAPHDPSESPTPTPPPAPSVPEHIKNTVALAYEMQALEDPVLLPVSDDVQKCVQVTEDEKEESIVRKCVAHYAIRSGGRATTYFDLLETASHLLDIPVPPRPTKSFSTSSLASSVTSVPISTPRMASTSSALAHTNVFQSLLGAANVLRHVNRQVAWMHDTCSRGATFAACTSTDLVNARWNLTSSMSKRVTAEAIVNDATDYVLLCNGSKFVMISSRNFLSAYSNDRTQLTFHAVDHEDAVVMADLTGSSDGLASILRVIREESEYVARAGYRVAKRGQKCYVSRSSVWHVTGLLHDD